MLDTHTANNEQKKKTVTHAPMVCQEPALAIALPTCAEGLNVVYVHTMPQHTKAMLKCNAEHN